MSPRSSALPAIIRTAIAVPTNNRSRWQSPTTPASRRVPVSKIVTPDNSRLCPNAPQYYGKLVNDVDRMVQIGAYRFPNNAAITAVEATAKKSTSQTATTFSTDAILFGKWRD
jgi:hypothetical protein